MDLQEKAISLLMEYGPRLAGSIILLIVGLIAIKWISNIIANTLQKSRLDASLHSFIRSIVNFMLKIVLLITIAAMLGIPMTTFIAVLSAAALAVGLSLKDSLSNFAGGVLILTSRPLSVGDFIETQGYMGTVKEIKLLHTYLTTPDNKVVVIPNGELSNAKLVNFTAEKTRRVDIVFGVSYEDDIAKVKEILTHIVSEHSLILQDPAPLIRVFELADNSVNFAVRVWCQGENYWDIYYDLHEKVKSTFDNEGITIPFPQRDIHLSHFSGEYPATIGREK